MDTLYLIPFGLLLLWWISNQGEKTFVEDHPMNIPANFGSIIGPEVSKKM
jgi:hypothetical protein